jgi:hypothetical protein
MYKCSRLHAYPHHGLRSSFPSMRSSERSWRASRSGIPCLPELVRIVKNMGLCGGYHLNGRCQLGDQCSYKHGEKATDRIAEVMRFFARCAPCPKILAVVSSSVCGVFPVLEASSAGRPTLPVFDRSAWSRPHSCILCRYGRLESMNQGRHCV